MEIREVQDGSSANGFLAAQDHNVFLQAWEWGEFLRQSGQPTRHWGAFDNGVLSALGAFTEKKIGLGKVYQYSPLGPVIDGRLKNAGSFDTDSFWIALRGQVPRKSVFLRLEPFSHEITQNRGFVKSIDIQPAKTTILDLSLDEDAILKQMHHKTRYNIRLASRKGVEIEEATVDSFNEFWGLMEQTAARDRFRLHPPDHYRVMLKLLCSDKQPDRQQLSLKLLFARYRGKLLAAVLIAFFGKYATYMHGASANERRNFMAPYALQWRAIQEAKHYNYQYYDFFGINERLWPGVTRFKRGFGGQEVSRPGTFDLPLQPVQYRIYKNLRRIKRKYL